jgi:hypothetical protein
VSHLLQRKEKNCLNCGTTVIGKYCHNCGQENVEPKETFWQLLSHFFSDFTHFDGKFFSTLIDLLFKPGYLPKEYMDGRRASYLNPIRMYLFTSFIFFLIFFSLFHLDEKQSYVVMDYHGKTAEQIEKMSPNDFDDFTKLVNNGKSMTRDDFSLYKDSLKNSGGIQLIDDKYKSKAEYDSLLKAGAVKDNWFVKKLRSKQLGMNEKYNHDQNKIFQAVINTLMHSFPQMLFISLPFVALFLKFLYIRRKKFYYVSHAIFIIHFYIFVFIVMMVNMGVSKLKNFSNLDWIGYINGLLALAIFYYLYKAMRNFYQQRRGKTILKYFIFLFSFLLLIVFLLGIFFFVSIFKV